ncbi:MAG: tetracycline resistance efflux pump [Burkholderiales bacterium]|jgi:DHA1 family tetracycline resistance protein-like MFS transporter|nr:tetracycline resistance efflux pump [Burkholderiales bacterium]MCE3268754.1 tetracycline resistance efflux pump [Burkholderiales bacterium]
MIIKTSQKKILWIIFLTVFIDMLGIGILVPVFPMLVIPLSPYRITPASWSMQDGFVMAGWLMAAYPLAQFICTPVLGQLADKYGRRKILSLSIGGTFISYLLFAYAIISKNLSLLFFARILDGCSGGNISVAQAVIGDISDPKSRAKNFGLIGVALGLGFIFGPFLGGKLSDSTVVSWFSIITPFIFAALLSIINVLLIIFILPETLVVSSNKQINIKQPIYNIIRAFKLEGMRSIILAVFMFNAGFTFFTTFWGIILANEYRFNQGQIGNFFGFMGIMIVLAQGLVVRRLSGKVQDYSVLRYSIIGTGICLVAYYFIPAYKMNISFIYYIPPFLAIFVALSKAFSSALITRITPDNIRGEVMGVSSSVSALAQAIPAVLAGYLATYHTLMPILAGSIVAISGGVLFILMFKTIKY